MKENDFATVVGLSSRTSLFSLGEQVLYGLFSAKIHTIEFPCLQEFLQRLATVLPLCSTLCSMPPMPLASAYNCRLCV